MALAGLCNVGLGNGRHYQALALLLLDPFATAINTRYTVKVVKCALLDRLLHAEVQLWPVRAPVLLHTGKAALVQYKWLMVQWSRLWLLHLLPPVQKAVACSVL